VSVAQDTLFGLLGKVELRRSPKPLVWSSGVEKIFFRGVTLLRTPDLFCWEFGWGFLKKAYRASIAGRKNRELWKRTGYVGEPDI
jgi:hypothetical protein